MENKEKKSMENRERAEKMSMYCFADGCCSVDPCGCTVVDTCFIDSCGCIVVDSCCC